MLPCCGGGKGGHSSESSAAQREREVAEILTGRSKSAGGAANGASTGKKGKKGKARGGQKKGKGKHVPNPTSVNAAGFSTKKKKKKKSEEAGDGNGDPSVPSTHHRHHRHRHHQHHHGGRRRSSAAIHTVDPGLAIESTTSNSTSVSTAASATASADDSTSGPHGSSAYASSGGGSGSGSGGYPPPYGLYPTATVSSSSSASRSASGSIGSSGGGGSSTGGGGSGGSEQSQLTRATADLVEAFPHIDPGRIRDMLEVTGGDRNLVVDILLRGTFLAGGGGGGSDGGDARSKAKAKAKKKAKGKGKAGGRKGSVAPVATAGEGLEDPDQLEVVMEASSFRGRTFLPWAPDDPAGENFSHFGHHHHGSGGSGGGSTSSSSSSSSSPRSASSVESLFVDPDGLLELTAEQNERCYRWARPRDFIDQPKMVVNRLSSKAITQSVIGDCAFLSAMALAAEYEARHHTNIISTDIYPQDENGMPVYNTAGKYVFKLFWNGVARKVVVDDLLPLDIDGRLLASASNVRSEIWVSLLEKAYMKVKGAYRSGSIGSTDMQILFGWVPESIGLFSENPNLDEVAVWTQVMEGYEGGDCLAMLGSRPDSDPAATGLLPSHAYAVLDVRVVASGHRLCLLKNPWGTGRWTGRFSVNDSGRWTQALQDELDFDLATNKMVDNGLFWIEWTEVIKHFSHLYLAWRPSRFSHHVTHHGRLTPYTGPLSKPSATDVAKYNDLSRIRVDPLLYQTLPQFVVSVESAHYATLFVILLKHVTETSEDDLMALDVYAKDGGRAFAGDDRSKIYAGPYSAQHDYLVKLEVVPGLQRFTVVVAHTKTLDALTFTLGAYSPHDAVSVTPVALYNAHGAVRKTKSGRRKAVAHEVEVEGTWDQKTSGGTASHRTYFLNHMYKLVFKPVDDVGGSGPSGKGKGKGKGGGTTRGASDESGAIPTDLTLVLSTPEKFFVGLRVMEGGSRLANVSDRRLVASSGKYCEYTCHIQSTLLGNTPYLVIPSTYQPGQQGEFRLSVQSSVLGFALERLPPEGAGMRKYVVDGRWEGFAVDGEGLPRGYAANPTFVIRQRNKGDKTKLMMRLQAVRSVDSGLDFQPALDIRLFRNRGEGSVDADGSNALATSGRYSRATSGVVLPAVRVPYRKRGYLAVVSTFPPHEAGAFELIIYASNGIDVAAVDRSPSSRSSS